MFRFRVSDGTPFPEVDDFGEDGQWEVVDLREGKAFLCGPESAPIGRIYLEGHGECLPVGREDLLAGINLLADAAFAGETPPWRISHHGVDAVALDIDRGQSLLRRSARNSLRVTITPAPESDQGVAFLVYYDPHWANFFPVDSGDRLRFCARLAGRGCTVVAKLEFFDEDQTILAAGQRDWERTVRLPGNERTTQIDLHATAPDEVYYGRLVLKILIDAYDGETLPLMELLEPILAFSDGRRDMAWRERPKNFKPFRRLLEETDRQLYVARLSPRFSLRRENKLRLVRDGASRPLDSVIVPVGAEHAKISINQVHSGVLSARVASYSGNLGLYVDEDLVASKSIVHPGKEGSYYFELPPRLLDGRGHDVRLVDLGSDAVLARGVFLFPHHGTSWEAFTRYCMPPLPSPLSIRARHWFSALEALIARFGATEKLEGHDAWLLRNAHRIHATIVRGFEFNEDFFALRFPQLEKPMVSIVVPVHGNYAATFHCLSSLLMASNRTDFEVIVVDDGSTDETAEELKRHEGITVVSREAAGGFVEACNEGAEQARGEYVLFLNNDVEVTVGWLDELVRVFEIFPGTGAACSKLLYPDGRLQDAGGIVWSNGQPANYGHTENPADPRFCYSRDADYLTGAALITLAKVWREIGGFAEELKPAYFEDTWYSFAVREQGLRTIYCALSEVYHVRGLSNGTDEESEGGLKQYQAINHPKFKQRWAGVYFGHGGERVDTELQKDRCARKRVLMVGWDIPKPDQDAGSYAAVCEARMLQRCGFKVTVAPANMTYLGRYNVDLQRLGFECIHAPFFASIDDLLQRRGREFDLVWVSHYNVLDPLVPAIREYAPQAKLALNVVDLHFLRDMRRAVFSGDSEGEAGARLLRDEELATISKVDAVLSYSEFEVDLLKALSGSEPIVRRLPWVQEPSPTGASFEERQGLCFLGSKAHPPNAEAVEHFAKLVLDRCGEEDLLLHLYGAGWHPKNNDFGSRVRIEGFAPELSDPFARHRIFVAPLTSGAGIKGKVLMAMAYGIPTILSPIASESLGATHMESCLIAENPEQWIEAVERLYNERALWERIREGALRHIDECYSFGSGVAQMKDLLGAIEIFV